MLGTSHSSHATMNDHIFIFFFCFLFAGLLIYVVMKQWRLRKAANKLAHFDPRGHHGSSATVPLNGATSNEYCKQQQTGHKLECEISPSGSRRQGDSEGSRGSRGSDSEFNAVAAPGSDGYGRDLKPSKSRRLVNQMRNKIFNCFFVKQ